MKQRQSLYDNIVLYSTSITWRFAGTFGITFCVQPLTAIYITHTENEVSSHTPYIVTYRPTPCDVSTHHMIVCYVHSQ